MGGFLNSIFTGSNPTLDKDQSQLGALAGYSSNTGQNATNADVGYQQGILSGDPAQVAKTLAPEIQTLQGQAQQNKNTVSQFGNRGGGMNAVMAGLDDATRAKLISLMGTLRQGAASNLGQIGTANLGMSANDAAMQAKIAQQQHENLMNSILGKGISGIGGAVSEGLGNAASGIMGDLGTVASNTGSGNWGW